MALAAAFCTRGHNILLADFIEERVFRQQRHGGERAQRHRDHRQGDVPEIIQDLPVPGKLRPAVRGQPAQWENAEERAAGQQNDQEDREQEARNREADDDDAGSPDIEARAVTQRTKVIYLGNPNNPTGTMFTAEDLDRLLDALPPRVLVVLDEAYYDYVQYPDYSHSLDYVRAGKNVLVLRTFCKVHGLAGLRIGYGVGHRELIEALNRIRSPFNANSVAQVAALAALDDREHLARSIESNIQEMKFVTEELTLLGVRYTPSVGNFLLIDTGRDCEEDFVRLLHEGVIVRPMKLYGFPTSVRVTVGTHPDNERFLEALRRVMSAPARLRAVTSDK